MENNMNESYVTFALSNIHNTLHENIISHEEICEQVEECILPDNGPIVETSQPKLLLEKSNNDDEIYIKQEQQNNHHHQPRHEQYHQQYTSGDDESLAVEALRQLGGMYPCPEIINSTCKNCKNTFSPTDYKIHEQTCLIKKYSCNICNELFDREIDLNNHVVCHQVDRPHSCRKCGNLFRSKALLQSHMLKIHKIEKLYKCKVCYSEFQRPSSLSNHMKIHSYIAGRAIVDNTIEKQQQWTEIITSDLNDGNLIEINDKNAASTTSNDVNIQDVINNVTTINNDRLNTIKQSVVLPNSDTTTPSNFEYIDTIQEEYNLIECTNKEDNNIKIEILEINQTNNNQYLCQECGVLFKNTSSLKNHEKIHKKKNSNIKIPIECEYCDKQYQDNEHLQLHQKTCAKKFMFDKKNNDSITSKYNKHSCEECNKKFTTKQKMYRHQWIHRKKTHICEQCGEQYETTKQLDEHRLNKHPGDSPFKCTICGRCFVSRQGLWEHKGRTHIGNQANFHCDKCQKNFSSRQGYLIHHRTHTGERPYGCKYCWKSFRDGGTLRKHERIHTGERPHVCPLCKRAFNQKVVLREHVRWVHAASKNEQEDNGPPYPCPICNVDNQDRDELCAHIVKHSDQMIADAKAKTSDSAGANKKTNRKNGNNNNSNKKGGKKLSDDDDADEEENYLDDFDNNEQHLVAINNGDNSETLLLVTTEKTIDNDGNEVTSISNNQQIIDGSFRIEKNDNSMFVLPATSQEYIHTITNNVDGNLSSLFLQDCNGEAIHFVDEKNNTLRMIAKDEQGLPVFTIDNSCNVFNNGGVMEIEMKSEGIVEGNVVQIVEYQDSNDGDLFDNDNELVCKLCGDNFDDKNVLMEHINVHNTIK